LPAASILIKSAGGKNTLINYDLIDLKNYIPLHDAKLSASEAVAEMPISDAGQATDAISSAE
jgi:hypothetical protein